VAERLGYTVVSEDLLEEAAKRFGAPASKLAHAMTGSQSFFNALTHDWEKSLVYLRATLAEILRADNQIYHGPAVPLIPMNITHILRVGIIASPEYRMERAREAGVTAEDAASRIRENNENLSRWTQNLFSSGPWDSSLFDLKISLPETSVSDAVEMICESVNKEVLKPTEASLQAFLDFQLASRVSLRLMENSQYSCTVTADRGKVIVVVNQKRVPSGALPRALHLLKYERAEEAVKNVLSTIDGIEKFEVRPGMGYRKASRILLVDDEREYITTLSERLQIRDIDTDMAYDGYQALSFVKSTSPDVMVLDLRMPGMDGFEVLQRIRRDHPNVKVIIITGHGSARDEKMAREYGAYDYMSKPIDIAALAMKIKEASDTAAKEQAAGVAGTFN